MVLMSNLGERSAYMAVRHLVLRLLSPILLSTQPPSRNDEYNQ